MLEVTFPLAHIKHAGQILEIRIARYNLGFLVFGGAYTMASAMVKPCRRLKSAASKAMDSVS
jgi:hypothetical protein